MKTKKLIVLFILFTTAVLSSCSEKELDRVNFDKNHPHEVLAKYILTDAITASAFTVTGGDIAFYSSVYVEHETGVHNQLYNAEIRSGEPTQSTTYNNVWGGIYANIRKLKTIIEKTSQGGSEEGNDVTHGIANVLLAYNLGVLTDFFGDVPFSESGVFNENGTPKFMQPKIDKQSELYTQLQKILDEAITLLAGSDKAASGPVGTNDLIYNGNKTLWLKAANGLKARYLMHTLAKSTDKNGDLAKIISYADKSFKSPTEELSFKIYDGTANQNPLYAFSNSRDALGASKSLLEKFKSLNDPRGEKAFMDYDFEQLSLEDALDEAAPNGTPIQQQYVYPISMAEYAATAPTLLLSYHEVMFLKAEAQARLNNKDGAKESLQKAIVAAFANLQRSLNSTKDYFQLSADTDLSSEVANEYFDNSVLARFDANPLKEIMLQKYLAFYGASGESTEAFNDIRRGMALSENFVELANPLNKQNKFPLRFPYGNDDVSANLNIKEAYGNGSYVYTENVWWAGGSR